MINQLKRHEVQVLLQAGHTQKDIARLAKVSVRTVRRVAEEPAVEHVDDVAERNRRRIGRPSTVEPFRTLITTLLEQDPSLLSVELLRRARLEGYTCGKSALFALAASLRVEQLRLTMRFEGLPGEFSQHDFGHVKVKFLDDSVETVHFFASRLKYSRWAEVTLVQNEVVETLIRRLAEHFSRFSGVPLCAVFDRPKTVGLAWSDDGVVTEWKPTFAYAALKLGFNAEVCWPHQIGRKAYPSGVPGREDFGAPRG